MTIYKRYTKLFFTLRFFLNSLKINRSKEQSHLICPGRYNLCENQTREELSEVLGGEV